jgi:hypothetical protein
MFLIVMLYSVCLASIIHAEEIITYEVYRGMEATRHVHHWPPLSVALTYDYPYLYVGKAEDENIEQFATDGTILVLVRADEKVVGIAIGTPVDSAKGDSIYMEKFITQDEHYHRGSAIYIVEVLVDKPYQHQGIMQTMAQLFEQTACEMGYTDMYGVTVERSGNHPFKTDDAPDLDVIWSNLGAQKTQLAKPANWPTRCGIPGNECVARVDNMLRLWHKSVRGN